jgi:superfamily I DNA/RNA helicase
MIDIQIAGAGAGKTYGLAKLILQRMNDVKPHNKIFALTYTNSAKSKIERELCKQNNGKFPDNVIVETVHGFLLNEVIFSFSAYILSVPYNKSSIIYLGSNPQFKNVKIKRLKEEAIIHVEVVYLVTKQILDKNNAKNKSKKQQTKVDNVLSILNVCIDSIFIDEVQDLDKDALIAFKALGDSGIFVHMTGDPKQAIKYPKAFTDFLSENNGGKDINCLPIDNSTRRVPNAILEQSNRFCYPDQKQKNEYEKRTGVVKYIESINEKFSDFIEHHSSCNTSLVYIDKKAGNYSTSRRKRFSFPIEIEAKIKNSNHQRDNELMVRAAYSEFCEAAMKDHKQAISNLCKKFSIPYNNAEYAQLHELCNKIDSEPAKFTIRSIDAVKGLEADTCIFILTDNTYEYFIQNIEKGKYFNKVWKQLYVALTRAKKELILVVDHDLFSKHEIKDVKSNLEKFSVGSIDQHV